MSGRKRCTAIIRSLDIGSPAHDVRSLRHSAYMSARMTTYFYVKNDNWPRANIQFIFALALRDSLKSRRRRQLSELARACGEQVTRLQGWRWLLGRHRRSRCRKAFAIAAR